MLVSADFIGDEEICHDETVLGEQIVTVPKRADVGLSVAELTRKVGTSEQPIDQRDSDQGTLGQCWRRQRHDLHRIMSFFAEECVRNAAQSDPWGQYEGKANVRRNCNCVSGDAGCSLWRRSAFHRRRPG
jgi:hypothetical protein